MNKSAPNAVMPIIDVSSVDEVRSYYVDRLGFNHVMGVVGKDGQFDFCTVVKDGARIMFSRAPGSASGAKIAPKKQAIAIYLEVSDVVAYHDQLQKKSGVKITDTLTMQWWGDKTFKVVDPCGYEIWFYQTVGDVIPPEGAKIV